VDVAVELLSTELLPIITVPTLDDSVMMRRTDMLSVACE
jgi:hypothetical protein